MIHLSTLLRHYKRSDVQEQMIEACRGREVSVRFNDYFGKRPDTLAYPRDILELAQKGATSFHVSEEHWRDPMQLSPNMSKKEQEDLRTGWDLVLDIDCKHWGYSKMITHLMIRALKKHGVKSISCKFSGNKGFHIGVPFEAFPMNTGIGETRLWFPDGPRNMAVYLTHYIDSKETDYELTRKIIGGRDVSEISKELSIERSKLFRNVCSGCGSEVVKKSGTPKEECPYCGESGGVEHNQSSFICSKCGKLVRFERYVEYSCQKCGGSEFVEKFDINQILDVDTLLISSRHLYRMPYSLHEKSGLCSLPIDPEKVLSFERKMANPDRIEVGRHTFLDRNIPGEDASNLFDTAFYWSSRKKEITNIEEGQKEERSFEEVAEAIPEELFPPCITKILVGLPDGKKRALFILINFLSNTGWKSPERRLREWNTKNGEPLREVYLLGQLRHYSQRKAKILPPNCSNKAYYADIGICKPDNLCQKIRNPVNYTLRKARHHARTKGKD
ncbi:MAG: hypothetical protein ABH879_04825 [archaeon]